jgi:hypothetical protein
MDMPYEAQRRISQDRVAWLTGRRAKHLRRHGYERSLSGTARHVEASSSGPVVSRTAAPSRVRTRA